MMNIMLKKFSLKERMDFLNAVLKFTFGQIKADKNHLVAHRELWIVKLMHP